MLTSLVPVLFAFHIQSVLKLKKNNSGAKGLMHKIKSLKCRNRSIGVITATETSSLKIHKSVPIFKQVQIVSDISVIQFYNYDVSNFCILYSSRWISGWPKHVTVQSVYKLILIQLRAFLGTTIVSRSFSLSLSLYIYIYIYTGCPRRNVPNFGRVFLRLKYTDITQNTYIQS